MAFRAEQFFGWAVKTVFQETKNPSDKPVQVATHDIGSMLRVIYPLMYLM